MIIGTRGSELALKQVGIFVDKVKLKAHIIKKSQEMNIKPTPIRLGKISKEEIGHSGYYLDGEDIIACMN